MQLSSHPNRKLLAGLVGFVAGALLILIAAAMAIVSSYTYSSAAAWVAHTHQVTSLDEVLSRLQDTETGQRGYIITGDPRYLEPYDKAVQDVAPGLERLARLTADKPDQRRRGTG